MVKNPNDVTAKIYDIISCPVKGPEVTDAEIALIATLIPPDKEILDVGVGTGRHLVPLVDLGYSVTGIEDSAEMLKVLEKKLEGKSKSKSKVHLINSNILDCNLSPDTYDLVILMWNAFNEIALSKSNAIKILKKLKNSLKKDGVILINSNNPEKQDMMHLTFGREIKEGNKKFDLHWKVIKAIKNTSTTIARELVEVYSGKKLESKTEASIKQRWWKMKNYEELAETLGMKLEQRQLSVNNELYLLLIE